MKGANFVLLLLDGLLIEPFLRRALLLLFRTNGLTIAGYNLMLKTYYNIYKQDCQPLYLFLQKASISLHSEFMRI